MPLFEIMLFLKGYNTFVCRTYSITYFGNRIMANTFNTNWNNIIRGSRKRDPTKRISYYNSSKIVDDECHDPPYKGRFREGEVSRHIEQKIRFVGYPFLNAHITPYRILPNRLRRRDEGRYGLGLGLKN